MNTKSLHLIFTASEQRQVGTANSCWSALISSQVRGLYHLVTLQNINLMESKYVGNKILDLSLNEV